MVLLYHSKSKEAQGYLVKVLNHSWDFPCLKAYLVATKSMVSRSERVEASSRDPRLYQSTFNNTSNRLEATSLLHRNFQSQYCYT